MLLSGCFTVFQFFIWYRARGSLHAGNAFMWSNASSTIFIFLSHRFIYLFFTMLQQIFVCARFQATKWDLSARRFRLFSSLSIHFPSQMWINSLYVFHHLFWIWVGTLCWNANEQRKNLQKNNNQENLENICSKTRLNSRNSEKFNDFPQNKAICIFFHNLFANVRRNSDQNEWHRHKKKLSTASLKWSWISFFSLVSVHFTLEALVFSRN